MKHTISVLVENHFGVLARVSGLFSNRGYNIDSLCVGVTLDPNVSRMTVTVHGEENVITQIMHQLKKLVEVIEVTDLTETDYVARELVLVKVRTETSAKRAEIVEIASIFRAKVVDVGGQSLIIEVTGSEGKISALVDMMRPFGIEEIVRTGEIAIARSEKQ
ncbi:MAG: acetolactate synthase small subunit [Candidatus Hydrogenedentes bacterium]|nr:acetolactate synthase small subunit [Candidatus Hydrogenedentota bacterium]